MKVAVVGATGLVGTKMLQVLAERNFPVTELLPVASERSIGKEIEFKGKKYKVVGMQDAIDAKPAVALFSAGGSTSLEWAPKFAAVGITVIDNSSAWRMVKNTKWLVCRMPLMPNRLLHCFQQEEALRWNGRQNLLLQVSQLLTTPVHGAWIKTSNWWYPK